MREIEAGCCESITEVGEVFKYRVQRERQYVLIALYRTYNSCKGCVFYMNSGHPLSREVCCGNGLMCHRRIFKPVNIIMEDL